jgi:hypothetical protein
MRKKNLDFLTLLFGIFSLLFVIPYSPITARMSLFIASSFLAASALAAASPPEPTSAQQVA